MRLLKSIYQMMQQSRERVIETMRERNIKKVNLIMPIEEFAKENGYNDVEKAEVDYDNYRDNDAPYVVYFNKWGNGCDYAALSAELEDGDVPHFKLECYNTELGTDTFYDYNLMTLTMANVYERMLDELELDDEPEKIWVLFDESLCDYELMGRSIMVFKNEDDARMKFKEAAAESRKTAKKNGWEIGSDTDDFFEAYPEGSWGTTHETVELESTVLNEPMWCKV